MANRMAEPAQAIFSCVDNDLAVRQFVPYPTGQAAQPFQHAVPESATLRALPPLTSYQQIACSCMKLLVIKYQIQSRNATRSIYRDYRYRETLITTIQRNNMIWLTKLELCLQNYKKDPHLYAFLCFHKWI